MSQAETGKVGESLALAFLKKQGYKIIDRNFRCRYGELDIIGYEGKTVSFIEVKTRAVPNFGLPEESVNRAKQRQLLRTARYYIKRKRLPDKVPCRFDVVSIILSGDKPKLKLIKNAFGLE